LVLCSGGKIRAVKLTVLCCQAVWVQDTSVGLLAAALVVVVVQLVAVVVVVVVVVVAAAAVVVVVVIVVVVVVVGYVLRLYGFKIHPLVY